MDYAVAVSSWQQSLVGSVSTTMLTNGVGSSAAAAADVAAAVAFAEECLKKVEMRVGMGTR